MPAKNFGEPLHNNAHESKFATRYTASASSLGRYVLVEHALIAKFGSGYDHLGLHVAIVQLEVNPDTTWH